MYFPKISSKNMYSLQLFLINILVQFAVAQQKCRNKILLLEKITKNIIIC